MKYFTLILLSFLFFLGIITGCDNQPDNPNIVLILVDDMGYGDPQCYMPNSKIPTPNIDKLASEGIRFTDAHSPSSVCSPTRYAILTGRYAWRSRLKSGVLGPYNSPLIEKDRLTIPKMLKEKGYSTALIGKWHLGMQWGTKNDTKLPTFWDRKFDQSVIDHSKPITGGPLTAGFDSYFGVDVPNFPPYCFIENNKLLGAPTIPKPNDIYGNAGMMLPGWKLEEILPTFTEKAVKYLDNYAKKRSEKPFFLQVTTTSPHTPIVPAKDFIGKSNAGPYGDLVHQTDYTTGEILKALKRNNLEKNTLVIFTSDNGSPARAGDPHVHGLDFQIPGSVITKYNHNPNAPNRGMKADIYEGGHRVPFIVKWPGHFPQNKISNEPICSVDIMATLANIVNYNLPANSAEDSYDLTELFKGKETGIDASQSAFREAIVHHSVNGSFAIRKGQWKMIQTRGTGGWNFAPHGKEKVKTDGQLYNLIKDPKESQNLWNAHPEIVKELEQILEKYKTEGRSVKRK